MRVTQPIVAGNGIGMYNRSAEMIYPAPIGLAAEDPEVAYFEADDSILHYGAVEDGVTDDSQAFNDMFAAKGYIILNPGKRYFIGSTIRRDAADMLIYGNNATVICGVDGPVFKMYNAMLHEQAVTAIGEEDIILATGLTRVSYFEVADATGYYVDNTIRIGNTVLLPGANPAANECRGELVKIARITAVSGGYRLHTYSPLREAYTLPNDTKIWSMQDQYQFSIDNLKFDCQRGMSTGANGNLIELDGVHLPKFSRLHCEYSYSAFIQLRSCWGAQGNQISIRNLQTSSSLYRYGYGVIEYECEFGNWSQLFGFQLRHLYTTGSSGSTTSITAGRPWSRGRTANVLVTNSLAVNCQNGGFSTHADGYNCTFDTCVSVASWRGPSGGSISFPMRGMKNKVKNCVSYGGSIGVSAFTEYNDVNNCQDIEIVNHTHYCYENGYDVATSANSVGISVDGKYPGNKLRVVIHNPTIYGKEDTVYHVHVQYASVTGHGGLFRAPQVGTNQGMIISVDNMSDVSWDHGTVDYTGATGTGFRTVKFQNTESNPTGSSAKMNNWTIKNEGIDWKYMVDFGSTASSFIGLGWECDQAPSDADASTGSSAAIVHIVDWNAKGGTAGRRSMMTKSLTSATDYTYDIGNAGADNLQLTLTATAGGSALKGVTRGNKDGQRLRIVNSPASSYATTLKRSTVDLIDIPADIDISVGAATELNWSVSRNAWVGALLGATGSTGPTGLGYKKSWQYGTSVTYTGDGVNDTTEYTFATITIPGGTLGAHDVIEVETDWSFPSGTVTKNIYVKFDGLAFTGPYALSTSNTTARVKTIIRMGGSTSVQRGISNASAGYGTSGGSKVTGSADTATDKDITITGKFASNVAAEQYELLSWSVRIITTG